MPFSMRFRGPYSQVHQALFHNDDFQPSLMMQTVALSMVFSAHQLNLIALGGPQVNRTLKYCTVIAYSFCSL